MANLGLNLNTDGDLNSTKQIPIQLGELCYTTGVNIVAQNLLCQQITIRDYLLKVSLQYLL